MQDAAVIAATFRIDPVAVLKGSWREWHVRLAAVSLHHEALKEATKRD